MGTFSESREPIRGLGAEGSSGELRGVGGGLGCEVEETEFRSKGKGRVCIATAREVKELGRSESDQACVIAQVVIQGGGDLCG